MTNQIGTVLPGSHSSEAPFVFRHAVAAQANRGQHDADGDINAFDIEPFLNCLFNS